MSWNNYIRIKWRKPSYLVDDCDFETDSPSLRIGTAKTLEKAVRIANKHMEENYVEYGLEIILPKKV